MCHGRRGDQLLHPFFLSSFQTEEKGREKKGRVIEPVSAWRVQQKCNIFRRAASFSFPHAGKKRVERRNFCCHAGGIYTLYIGAWKCTFAKNKADRSNSRKKSCYGINQIVVIHLGFAMNMLIIFFCNENWANFHCHRPKIVCSLLFLLRATTSITQPPYRPPYESSCCILTLTPLSLLRIAFSPLHSRREKRAHFQGQRRHDFCWRKIYLISRESLTGQAKGVNFGGRAF